MTLTQPVPQRTGYVGLVTRGLAFAADAAIANGIAILVAAVVSLTLSVVHVPDEWTAVLVAVGGFVWLLWIAGYFVACWSATGQTPGDRLLRIRVVTADGQRLRPGRAMLRFAALLLAALPLLAGFLPILVDSRRRGLHDFLARTVVVEAG